MKQGASTSVIVPRVASPDYPRNHGSLVVKFSHLRSAVYAILKTSTPAFIKPSPLRFLTAESIIYFLRLDGPFRANQGAH